jgi:hypothetical protein
MSIAELKHGRGTPMSAHELTVIWPEFFAYRGREIKRQQAKQSKKQGRA